MATVEVVQGAEQAEKQPMPNFRWMIWDDLPEVLDIELQSFRDPWDQEDFERCKRKGNCLRKVVEVDGQVIAFFVYELREDHLLLLNLAVHPDYRGQGIGERCILNLKRKLRPPYTRIVALVPVSLLKDQAPFFEKYGITIRPADEKKSQITCKPVFAAMTKQDAEEVQTMENAVLGHYGREPRNLGNLLASCSCYGIVARDQPTGILMGYVLYQRDSRGIACDGQIGVIVDFEFRRRGVGRMLVAELVQQGLSITFYDVCLTCGDQCDFLRAIGVPVPMLQRFVNVEWAPAQPKG